MELIQNGRYKLNELHKYCFSWGKVQDQNKRKKMASSNESSSNSNMHLKDADKPFKYVNYEGTDWGQNMVIVVVRIGTLRIGMYRRIGVGSSRISVQKSCKYLQVVLDFPSSHQAFLVVTRLSRSVTRLSR